MKKNYQIKLRKDIITANDKLTETVYGGWFAQNVSNVIARVCGIILQQGETLSSQQIMKTNPGDLWQEPIEIEFVGGTGAVQILRAVCKEL